MSEFTGYHNGAWKRMSQIVYDPNDMGPSRGDQVVEMVRTFGGASFRMKEHVDRLYRSLKYVRIDPGLSPSEMLALSEEGIERNAHLREAGGDIAINHIVTRGAGGPRAWAAGPPHVFIKYSAAAVWYAEKYTEGARAVITRTRSYDADALDAKVKHLSRMNMSLAELEANDLDPGAWPILTDRDGFLTEGSGYNVFIVTDGVARTPDDRAILAGVSRAMALDLCKQLGIPATEENLQPYDAHTADEAFFTSTPFSILPVTFIDRRPVGDGKPGPITMQLLAAWSESVGVDIIDQAIRTAERA